MNERGRNSGLTGTVDVQGGPSFEVTIYGWKRRRDINVRNVRPRGQNWMLPRHMAEGANLLMFGKVRTTGPFEPTTLQNATGTVTTQLHTGRKVAYSVRFTSCYVEYSEKDKDTWDVSIGAIVTSQPTHTWVGSQVDPTAPSSVDEQETPDGVTVKVLDPKDLQESSTVVYDLYGLADTNSAEVTRIESYFTMTPPVTGHKVRSVALTRQGRWGATVVISLGLTDTEDDVEMPGTAYTVDESSLQSSASVTVVEDDSTPDGGISVSGLVLRSTTKRQLHDSKWAITYNFAETTAEDDVEFAGTITNDDPSNLIDSATVAIVNSSATYPVALDTPPSGLKLRKVVSRQLTNGDKWVHTGEYGRRSNEDDVEQGGTVYSVDQSGNIVTGSARVTVVESDATPDGGVTVSGLVLREIEKKQIHDTKWEMTYIFGQNTPEDDIEFDNTVYENDVSNINDSAKVALVTNSSTYPVALDTPPSTPTTATLKLRRVVSRKLTTPGIWLHIGMYAMRTEEDEIEQNATEYQVDQSTNVVGGSARVTVVESDATPDGGVTVSGLVLRFTEKKQLNDGKWAITYVFGQNTPEEDIEYDGTVYENDVSNLVDSARVTLINGSTTYPVALDTPPTTPATATLKLQKVVSKKLTTSGQWQHTGFYGLRTEEDRVEQEGTRYQVDQSGNVVAGSARVTVVESDSAPDGGVSVSGLVLRFVEKEQLNDGKWAITYVFGQNTPESDIEFDGTVYVNDVSNLTDSARVALVNNSSAYPVALDTPPSTPTTGTLKLRQVITRQLTTSGQWLHIGVYGLVTEEDEIEYGGTILSTDPEQDRDVTTSVVAIASYSPATLDGVRDQFVTDNIGLATFDRVDVKQLTPALAEVRLLSIVQGKILRENIDTKYEVRRARGSSVMVSHVRQSSASQYWGVVIPQRILVTSGTIRLRRRVAGSTRQAIFNVLDTTHYSNRVGLTNNAAFLGYPVKGLMYLGWDAVQDWGRNGTNHLVDIDFKFALDSIGHYNDEQVNDRADLIPALPGQSLTIGYNAASKFGWTITEPLTADFSVFTA